MIARTTDGDYLGGLIAMLETLRLISGATSQGVFNTIIRQGWYWR